MSMNSLLLGLLSLLGGSGVGWFVAKSAVKEAIKEAIKDDLQELKNDIAELKKTSIDEDTKLHKRINEVEKNYVASNFCTMQNENTMRLFNSIDHKLNTLLEHNMK